MVLQDQVGQLDQLDLMEILDLQVQEAMNLDQVDKQAFLVPLEEPVSKDREDSPVAQDLQVLPAQVDQLGQEETVGQLDQLGQVDQLEKEDLQDQQESLDPQGHQDQRDHLAQLVQ